MGTATRYFYIYNQSQSCDRNGKIENKNEFVLLKVCVIEKLYINVCRQYATICQKTAIKCTMMSAFYSLHRLNVNLLFGALTSFFKKRLIDKTHITLCKVCQLYMTHRVVKAEVAQCTLKVLT